MEHINESARKVMDALTEGIRDRVEQHKTIDNTEGFMAVVVEYIGDCEVGKLFSVAHYGKQCGDLMRDPEMVFIRAEIDDEYYPIDIWQDYTGTYTNAAIIENGKLTRVDLQQQADLVSFANMWMRNIKEQQAIGKQMHST